MEDKTAIREALDLLRTPRTKRSPHSWTKGALHSEAGGHCILGALFDVQRKNGLSDTLINRDQHAIREVIAEHFPTKRARPFGVAITSFNDYPRRNFGEVEQAMEKAAVLREEEGAISKLSDV